MRTKDEIIKQQNIDLRKIESREDIDRIQNVILTEVLIDIRDILFEQLNDDQERAFKLYQLS